MYSKKEEFLNTLTHFFGLILTIIGIPFMLYFNNDYTEYSLFSIMLFLFGLFCVYLTSTIYHYTKNKKLKSVFQKLDHISIFLFNIRLLCASLPYNIIGFFWNYYFSNCIYTCNNWNYFKSIFYRQNRKSFFTTLSSNGMVNNL